MISHREVVLIQVHLKAGLGMRGHQRQQLLFRSLRRVRHRMLADVTAPRCRILRRPQPSPVHLKRAAQPLDEATIVREQRVRMRVELHGRREPGLHLPLPPFFNSSIDYTHHHSKSPLLVVPRLQIRPLSTAPGGSGQDGLEHCSLSPLSLIGPCADH